MDIYNRRIPALDFTWEVVGKNSFNDTFICKREVGESIVVTMENGSLPIGYRFEWLNPIAADFIVVDQVVVTKVGSLN